MFDLAHKAQQARKIAEFLAKPEVKEMSAGLEEIAQAVAVAVEDKALTQRIYEKSMEKFDGATNVLWMHLEADSKLKASGGWNKRVDAELGKSRKNAVVKGLGNVDVAIKKFEKIVGAPLQLFWAFPDTWDKKSAPLVAFIQPGLKSKILMAFDAKRNQIAVDEATARRQPVLVISINERTTPQGMVKNTFLAPQAINGKSTASAQSGNSIILQQAFFTATNYEALYDEWNEGPPEFTCDLLESRNGPRIKDNYLGNISLGGWTNVWSINQFTNPPSNQPFVLGEWPAGSSLVFAKYWEDDYWFFDDFVGEHSIAKQLPPSYVHDSFNPKARYYW